MGNARSDSRRLALLSFLGLLSGCASPVTNEIQRRPNVVVIVGDDLGYSDLQCYGGLDMTTPRIDALAAEGVRLTSEYVSAPICAPARAGLMTGRYQARFGYDSYMRAIDDQVAQDKGVSTDEILLPELMQAAGYVTAVIGKWHLGVNEKYRPMNRGVDRFFGFLAGGHDYFNWGQAHEGPNGGPIWSDETVVEGEGYLTEAFTAAAIEFIDEQRDRPFFLYVAYQNIHTPVQLPNEYLPARGGVPGRKSIETIGRAHLIGMIQALDRAVGDILDALERNGLTEDTLVVFVNDNGAPFERANAPLSGKKGQLFEGGVRVPFLFRWPGTIPCGITLDDPIIQLDILPTAVALAGGELPSDRPIDGVDVLPYLTGQKREPPHEHLFWSFGDRYAVRAGTLKLHRDGRGGVQLFDLATDVGEKHDLAESRPDDVRKLSAALDDWIARVAEDV